MFRATQVGPLQESGVGPMKRIAETREGELRCPRA